MHSHPNEQELFNGEAVALHDLDLDIFIAKGHHDEAGISRLLQAGDGIPPLFRNYRVTEGTLTHSWTRFAWHKPRCDAAGQDAPWCNCGLDEGGSRVDWHPTAAGPSTADAIPVTWFKATS